MLSASLRTGTTTETSGPFPLGAFVSVISWSHWAVCPNMSRRQRRAFLWADDGPGNLFDAVQRRPRQGQDGAVGLQREGEPPGRKPAADHEGSAGTDHRPDKDIARVVHGEHDAAK